jgi:CBS domain-containing protein
MVKAKAIMKTRVLSVTKDTDVYEAIRIMVANQVTGLPVIDDNERLVGIVTEKDVLHMLYEVEDSPNPVSHFMTQPVVSFDEEEDLEVIAESLRGNNFRRVPILREGQLVGVISRRDVIRHITEQRLGVTLSL